jgi:hypothetical protein
MTINEAARSIRTDANEQRSKQVTLGLSESEEFAAMLNVYLGESLGGKELTAELILRHLFLFACTCVEIGMVYQQARDAEQAVTVQ